MDWHINDTEALIEVILLKSLPCSLHGMKSSSFVYRDSNSLN